MGVVVVVVVVVGKVWRVLCLLRLGWGEEEEGKEKGKDKADDDEGHCVIGCSCSVFCVCGVWE
jgi:hypothetical protein